jgi:hypothetical protein
MEDIILVEHGDGDGVYYTFCCSECGGYQAYPADNRFIDFMKMNGIETIVLEAPIEYKEALDNPPLSWDDLLDLHLQLQDES